jgi:hypothetical protein
MKSIYHIPSTYFPSFLLLLPLVLPPNTVTILQSCFSLLIFKLMFQGVFQCTSTVSIPYFGLFSLFHYSPLPLNPPPPIFQQLSVHILLSSTFTSYIMCYYWCSIILFSFPSFPEFHRVVALLQTCSTYEFVYDHAWFCVYVYLWIYLPLMRENVVFVFLTCLTSLSMMSLNWIHLPSNHMTYD